MVGYHRSLLEELHVTLCSLPKYFPLVGSCRISQMCPIAIQKHLNKVMRYVGISMLKQVFNSLIVHLSLLYRTILPFHVQKFMTYCITELLLRLMSWDWCLVIGICICWKTPPKLMRGDGQCMLSSSVDYLH
jgi:hypothetical protein